MSPVINSVLLFWAVLFVASTLAAVLIIEFIPKDAKVSLRPITQQSLAVAGMMFAILLGFFIAQSLRDYTNAANCIVNEANSLGEVFRDARGLPEVDRLRIRGLCRQYCDSVIKDEWPLLAKTMESDKTQAIMNDLWNAALSVKPTNMREHVVYQCFFKAMNDFGGYRRVRTATNTAGLSITLWIIIGIGAASIVALTFLFAPDNKKFHTAILCCLLIPLTLDIFLLADYSYPFSGLIHIKPAMYESLKRKILSQDDLAPHYLTDDQK